MTNEQEIFRYIKTINPAANANTELISVIIYQPPI